MKDLELENVKVVKLDKYTFGKTPACMYLAKILNDLNDVRLVRKVSKTLVNYKENFNQLEKANQENIITINNLSMIINIMRKSLNIQIDNLLVSNLVNNIIIGDMKSIMRKAQKVKKIENAQVSLVNKIKDGKSYKTKDGYPIISKENNEITKPQYDITQIKDLITAETLTKKWEGKMIKRNIIIKD